MSLFKGIIIGILCLGIYLYCSIAIGQEIRKQTVVEGLHDFGYVDSVKYPSANTTTVYWRDGRIYQYHGKIISYSTKHKLDVTYDLWVKNIMLAEKGEKEIKSYVVMYCIGENYYP